VFSDVSRDPKKRQQRLDHWKRQGYFVPTLLKYECRLPGATYSLRTTQRDPQERGHCGANQPITLNLTRNGKPALERLTIGDACAADGAYVTSVDVSEPPDGWGNRRLTLCVVGQPAEAQTGIPANPQCELLWIDQLVTSGPITAEAVERYAKVR
jgi:hypothetical protein